MLRSDGRSIFLLMWILAVVYDISHGKGAFVGEFDVPGVEGVLLFQGVYLCEAVDPVEGAVLIVVHTHQGVIGA